MRIFSITKAIFEDKRGEKLDAEQREINQLIKVAHNAISYHYFSLSKDLFYLLLLRNEDYKSRRYVDKKSNLYFIRFRLKSESHAHTLSGY